MKQLSPGQEILVVQNDSQSFQGIHLYYTVLDGGDAFKKAVKDAMQALAAPV